MKLARHDKKENTISNYQLFIVENIEKLIGNAEKLVYKLNRDTLTNRFKLLVQSFETKYNKSLRNELEIPKSTYYYWINGRAIPTLENLFRFCYSLGITIEDFFFKDKVQFCKRDFRVGFNSESIIERKKIDHGKLSKQLIAFMIYEHPLSMEEIARRIMVSKRTLYRKFPDLCKSLSNRYMEEIKIRSLARREQVESLIEKAIIELNENNLYPTQKRIEKHLSANSLLREGYAKEFLIKCLEPK